MLVGGFVSMRDAVTACHADFERSSQALGDITLEIDLRTAGLIEDTRRRGPGADGPLADNPYVTGARHYLTQFKEASWQELDARRERLGRRFAVDPSSTIGRPGDDVREATRTVSLKDLLALLGSARSQAAAASRGSGDAAIGDAASGKVLAVAIAQESLRFERVFLEATSTLLKHAHERVQWRFLPNCAWRAVSSLLLTGRTDAVGFVQPTIRALR